VGRVADDLVARVLGGGAVALDDLFTASDTLNDGDEPPSTRVDLLRAMWLVDTEDAALPWNSASVMGDAGHHIEAAWAELEAARRFEHDVATGRRMTDDEEDWADTAIYHACRYFLMGGAILSATVLVGRIRDAELRAEVVAMLTGHQSPDSPR
jgi:hypothetical protein